MNKEEVYRVKQGKLVGENIEIPIDFGIVFFKDGIYSLEVYVPESVNIREITDGANNHVDDDFTAHFITEDKNELEICDLSISNVAYEPRRIGFTSHGCVIHRDISPFRDALPPDINKAELFYLELEGMKLEFSDLTSTFHHRISYDQKTNGMEADHTGAQLVVEQIQYSQIFRKSSKNDNIVVEFHGQNRLLYNEFIKFKKDYVALLSFLNGAEVKIRKEYAGDCTVLGTGDIHTPIVVVYSFRKIRNESFNNYIPIGFRIQNRNPNILNEALSQCFDEFRNWNAKVDLASTIFYLNAAENARTVEEKFFILIIAFERLTTLYAEQTGLVDQHIPSPTDFISIRQEFYTLLQKHEAAFGSNYEKARSIIGNLHEVKRLSTKDKMHGMLNSVNIPVDDDLRDLINVVRNKVIHKGDVGPGWDGVKYLYLLNELLREILCRLMKYNGKRISKMLLTKSLFEKHF